MIAEGRLERSVLFEPSIVLGVMAAPPVTGVCISLLLPRLIDGGPLRDALVVAPPHDVCVGREGEEALDCLSVSRGALS